MTIHRARILESQGAYRSALAARPIGEKLRLLDDLRQRALDLRGSLSIELDDLDDTPFNQEGGLGKAHQLFGDQLPKLLEELNEALAA
jgi:type I restriction enzyme R subunit